MLCSVSQLFLLFVTRYISVIGIWEHSRVYILVASGFNMSPFFDPSSENFGMTRAGLLRLKIGSVKISTLCVPGTTFKGGIDLSPSHRILKIPVSRCSFLVHIEVGIEGQLDGSLAVASLS